MGNRVKADWNSSQMGVQSQSETSKNKRNMEWNVNPTIGRERGIRQTEDLGPSFLCGASCSARKMKEL